MRKATKQFLRKGLCSILCTAMLFTGVFVPEHSVSATETDVTNETEVIAETEIAEEKSDNKESVLEEASTETAAQRTEESEAEETTTDDLESGEAEESTKEENATDKEVAESSESKESEVETSETITEDNSKTQEEEVEETEVTKDVLAEEIKATFYLYVGNIDGYKVGVNFWTGSDVKPPTGVNAAGWCFWNKGDAYSMNAVDGQDGWYSIEMAYINNGSTNNGFTVRKVEESAEKSEGEVIWGTDELSEVVDKLKTGTDCAVKNGKAYASIAEAEEGASDEVTEYKDKTVNLNYYVGDLIANANEEVGFCKWGESITLDIDKNPALAWGGWNDIDKNPAYKMEKVEGHSGWFNITFTANEEIVTNADNPANNSSLGGFSIFRSTKTGTALIECDGSEKKYPEIYVGLLKGEVIAIKNTNGVPVGYASIEEAEEATKEPDEPEKPDEPRVWTLEELKELINEADDYVESDYTKASWKKFATALADAKVIRDKKDATKEEIMAAYEALGIAKDTLASGLINMEKIELEDSFIMGADLSSYVSVKNSGVIFRDEEGNELDDAAFFKYLKDGGTNWVRIRVWNNPFDSNGKGYGGGNNDIEVAKKIGKWASDAGMQVLIDFHYSDFWADPGKQQEPKAWKGYSVDQKAEAVEKYTKESLEALKAAGVKVGMVQIGNETTASICGVNFGNDWTNAAKIFNAGSKAVREFDPNCLVAIHFTNPEKVGRYESFAKNLDSTNVDYDVFASSYYPYWHGTTENLTTQLTNIAKTYNKKVMVAETSWATSLADQDGHPSTVRPGNNDKDENGNNLPYSFSVQGQADELRAVIKAVNDVNTTVSGNGIGIFYWEPAWISKNYVYRADGGVNQELLDQNKETWEEFGSGWAASYGGEYDPEDAGVWYGGTAITNQAWFDFFGNALPTAKAYSYIRAGKKAERAVSSVENPSITIDQGEKVSYPSEVTVYFNDKTEAEYPVVWNNADKDAVDIEQVGEYTVGGTVTCEYELSDGSKVTRKVKTTLKITVKKPVGENLLTNPGFEDTTDYRTGWSVGSVGFSGEKGNDPRNGTQSLHFYSAAVFSDAIATQTIKDLEPGVYTFGGYIQGGGAGSSDLQYTTAVVYNSEGVQQKEYTASCSLSGWKNWQNPEIENIVVSEGDYLVVGVKIMSTVGGAWGTIDDLYLYGTYDVLVDDNLESGTGTITVNLEKAVSNQTIKIEAVPEKGYYLSALSVSGAGVTSAILSGDNGTSAYADNKATLTYPEKTTDAMKASFKMPEGSVTISATFTSSGVIDKTNLLALIAKCEEVTDSNKYTEASWNTFTQALREAQEIADNDNATQPEINLATTTLQKAFDGLDIIVDKTELNNLIEQYKDQLQDNYTDKSWQAFQDALNAAKEIAEKTDVTQDEVDEAKDALQNAYDGLEESASDVPDFTQLKQLLDECKAIEKGDYTESSWTEFKKALDEAQAVADNENAIQAEINNAKNALEAARKALKTNREESLEALNNLITDCENKKKEDYTTESWNALEEALNAAQNVVNNSNATQEEIDSAKETLQKAYDELKPATATELDFSELNKLISAYENLHKEDFTTETWTSFEEELNAAKALTENPNATQEAIDSATDSLKAAFDRLKLTPAAELDKLISDCENLTEEEYTKESWIKLTEALEAAKEVRANEEATKAQLNSAKENLKAAFDGLKPATTKPDFTELDNLISICESLDQTKYTEESWNAFAEALQAAKDVKDKADVTQDEISNAKVQLQTAYDALEELPTTGANFTELNKLIVECESLKAEDYTEASWKTFSEALKAAKEVSANTQAAQETVDEAYKNLKTAKDNLENIPVISTDFTELNKLIVAYGNLNEEDYTEETWTVFAEALKTAREIAGKKDATQAEVDSAKDALQAAFDGLAVPKPPVIRQGLWAEEIEDIVYSGKALKPEVKVYDGETLLSLNKDYTVSYKNNTNAGEATVLIKGKGNYADSVEAKFNILPKRLDEADISISCPAVAAPKNNKAVTPKPVVTRDGVKLKSGKDYIVVAQDGGYREPGIHEIEVKAVEDGNYTGSKKLDFIVASADQILMSKVTIKKIPNQKYSDKIEPELTVTYKGETLTEGEKFDYIVKYDNNTDAGQTATVTITGTGVKYVGEKTATFKITGTALKAKDVVLEGASNLVYTGEEQRPAVQINGLTEGVDYTVTYQNNKNAGTATVLVKGQKGYTGTVKKTFKIAAFNIQQNADNKFQYASGIKVPFVKGGSKLTDADLNAAFNGNQLVQGTDYTLTYRNNKKAETTANVTIKGKGNYTGTVSTTFEVGKQDIGNIAISAPDVLEKNAKKYNKIKLVVTDLDGKALKKGTDYDNNISYTLNDGSEIAGTPAVGTEIYVTIQGKGNYEGKATATFRIIANDKTLAKAVIKVSEQYYTGKEVEPHGTEDKPEDRAVKVSLKVKENGSTVTYDLREGVDYEIIGYAKNINKGTAKLTIHGIGEYGGTKTGSFKIKQQPMKWYETTNNMLLQLKELLD